MERSQLDRILRIQVPIVVLMGEKTMRLADVLSLQPGMILELPKRAEAELDLHVNNTPIGQGLAVKVGENFGIRLTHIGSVNARIQALGGEAGPSEDEAASIAEQLVAEQL